MKGGEVSAGIGTRFEPRVHVTKKFAGRRADDLCRVRELTGRNRHAGRRRRLRREESDGDDAQKADEAEQSDNLHVT